MKYLPLIAFIIASVVIPSCSQQSEDSNVPKAVVSSFHTKYHDVENVTWSMTSNADWEARFTQYNSRFLAKFNSKGDWLETDHKIIKSGVPLNVKLTLHDYYKDYEIEDVFIAEKQTGKFYEMEIMTDGHEFDVEADSDGTLTNEKEHI